MAANFAAAISYVHQGTLAAARRHFDDVITCYRGIGEPEATRYV